MGTNHPVSGRKARAVIARQGEYLQAFGGALEAQTKRLRAVEDIAANALMAAEWFQQIGLFSRLWFVLTGGRTRRAVAVFQKIQSDAYDRAVKAQQAAALASAGKE